MSNKEIDVSKAKDGKVKLVHSTDIELEVIPKDFPPPVKIPSGRTVTWLAHFDVKKKNKKDANDKVKYQIKLTGEGNYVFWAGPGTDLKWNLKRDDPIFSNLTGDPAIGMGT